MNKLKQEILNRLAARVESDLSLNVEEPFSDQLIITGCGPGSNAGHCYVGIQDAHINIECYCGDTIRMALADPDWLAKALICIRNYFIKHLQEARQELSRTMQNISQVIDTLENMGEDQGEQNEDRS